MDERYSRVKSARRGAILDVWAGMIGAITVLGTVGNEELYLPFTGGRYLLSVRDFMDKNEHKDFEVREGRSQGF